ncbi:MAG: hypothetical protein JWO94_2874 [Verrucomicrobiaceae bacterium]|nr:hypothetical protein [Verrucomicrobiaceae bacterium]
MPVICPACFSPSVDNEGALPQFPPNVFGGERSALAIDPGSMMHCRKCGLSFRYPAPSEEVLTSLYENLPDTVWEGYQARPYWPLALTLLEKYASNRDVLDVGCFAGDLLNWLPAAWRKHGVEPCNAARDLAATRGIQIVGRTADDLGARPAAYGAIISFDVIEHITHPAQFLTRLRDALAPGGCLVLLTGATDSLPYRLFGRHYWYGSFPEHVSFYSLAWFAWAAEHLGMKVSAHHYLSSERRDWKLWAKQFTQITIHTLFSVLRERGISDERLARLPVIGRAARWKTVPWWKQATDHVMVVMTKK